MRENDGARVCGCCMDRTEMCVNLETAIDRCFL